MSQFVEHEVIGAMLIMPEGTRRSVEIADSGVTHRFFAPPGILAAVRGVAGINARSPQDLAEEIREAYTAKPGYSPGSSVSVSFEGAESGWRTDFQWESQSGELQATSVVVAAVRDRGLLCHAVMPAANLPTFGGLMDEILTSVRLG